MKKRFIVEVDYEELEENIKNNTEVFYDLGLEVGIENLMEGYKATNSIKENYAVTVKEIDIMSQICKDDEEFINSFLDKYELEYNSVNLLNSKWKIKE